jgi:hypothetical protein
MISRRCDSNCIASSLKEYELGSFLKILVSELFLVCPKNCIALYVLEQGTYILNKMIQIKEKPFIDFLRMQFEKLVYYTFCSNFCQGEYV